MAYRKTYSSRTRRSYTKRPAKRSYRASAKKRTGGTRKRASPRQQVIKVVLQMVQPAATLPIGQKPLPSPKKARF